VTNASVIRRIWDNQEEFQLEVVHSILDSQGDREVGLSSQALTKRMEHDRRQHARRPRRPRCPN